MACWTPRSYTQKIVFNVRSSGHQGLGKIRNVKIKVCMCMCGRLQLYFTATFVYKRYCLQLHKVAVDS